MTIRSIHHVCIQTSQYEESLAFYTEGLGFKIVKETPNFHGRAYNTWLQLDSIYIELQTAKAGEALEAWSSKQQGMVHLCFVVDDLQGEYRRLKALGYSFKQKNGEAIYLVEDGYLCKVKAPEGTEIELRENGILA
ncbi:VOC family protein [Rubeoparvulum massiliense]|uniref:VOC family protein n=1 Tax=Rubeoparvulum massiliense TaxID=1631346 RepID=UPI00065E9965|nr:VOC family protein [Rubeoparvulum massiliense]